MKLKDLKKKEGRGVNRFLAKELTQAATSMASIWVCRNIGPRLLRHTAVRRKCFLRFSSPWMSAGVIVQNFTDLSGSSATPSSDAVAWAADSASTKLTNA